jgi:hypothetical protein
MRMKFLALAATLAVLGGASPAILQSAGKNQTGKGREGRFRR